MVKFLILVALLFGIALGFHWLKDTSGEVVLTIADTAYAVDLTIAIVVLLGAFLVAVGLLWFLQELLASPRRLALGWRRRNQERGRTAISQGLIAVAAGDLRTAERAMQEASRRAPDQPLGRLLQAQAAQLKGDRAAARRIFQDMAEDPQTRIAGLRGLYVEAEREGEQEAAYLIAARAREESPSSPWAARALLRHQTASSDWDGALKTLSGAADGRVLDKRTARRQRAVLLAAKALEREDGDPDAARHAALEAHDLAPDLVPAAAAAGRLLSRQGDIRRATRVLEATWKATQHPDIAEAYLHVRAGDSASDRLKRAETLHRMRPQADEGRLAVARAAIEARDFARAREALTPVLTSRPTQRALMLMAELEEAETGDRGRAREWLARAVRAPRDPAWTADGMILQAWAPASPVTGRLDAVEWKVPVAELESPQLQIEAADLHPPAPPEAEPAVLANEAEMAAGMTGDAAIAPAGLLDEGYASEPAPAATAALETDGRARPVEVAAAQEARSDGAASVPRPDDPRPAVTLVAGTATAAPVSDPDRGEPPPPPLPDDPGVSTEDNDVKETRRFRVF